MPTRKTYARKRRKSLGRKTLGGAGIEFNPISPATVQGLCDNVINLFNHLHGTLPEMTREVISVRNYIFDMLFEVRLLRAQHNYTPDQILAFVRLMNEGILSLTELVRAAVAVQTDGNLLALLNDILNMENEIRSHVAPFRDLLNVE